MRKRRKLPDADHISGELLKGFLLKRPLSSEQIASMKANNPQIDDEIISKLQNGLPAIPLHCFAAYFQRVRV